MSKKEFKTIGEQVEILKNRGLNIANEEEAKDFLFKNNYYRVSGYTLTLRSNDVFFPNKNLSNIKDIYYFDKFLRHNLLVLISEIETTVKAIYAYRFCEKYNPYAYLDSSLFTDIEKYESIIEKVENQKEQVKSFELCVKHFIEKKEEFPFWAYIELFTFGNMSQFFSISHIDLKKLIAADFGFTMNKGARHFETSLRVITTLRNLCAHGSRLYNRRFISKPSLNKEDQKYLRSYVDGTQDNDHLFAFLLAIKRIVSKDSFNFFIKEFKALHKAYPTVHLTKYGFPNQWVKIFSK